MNLKPAIYTLFIFQIGTPFAFGQPDGEPPPLKQRLAIETNRLPAVRKVASNLTNAGILADSGTIRTPDWITTTTLVLKSPKIAFESALASIPVGDKEDVRISIGEQGFQDSEQKTWFSGCVNERGVIYRMNADGGIIDEIWTPAPHKTGRSLHIDGSISISADKTPRYAAGYGYVNNVSTDEGQRSIIFYDAITQKWDALKPPIKPKSAMDIKFFGENLIYTFKSMSDSEGSNPGGHDPLGTSRDTVVGVMCYNINKKTYSLLASNKRDLTHSPIDKGIPENGNRSPVLLRVSNHELMVEKCEGYVYDALTNDWRPSTPKDKNQARSLNNYTYIIELGGIKWSAQFDSKLGLILTEFQKHPARRIKIPIQFTDNGIESHLTPYKALLTYYKHNRSGLLITTTITPDGVALCLDSVYYWIPKAQLNALLMNALNLDDGKSSSATG